MSTTWVTPAVTTPQRRGSARRIVDRPVRAAALAGVVAGTGWALTQSVRGRKLTRQLGELSVLLDRHRHLEQERVHDARSAAAAIAGAAHMLRRGSHDIDADALHALLVDEARRLLRAFEASNAGPSDVDPPDVHGSDVDADRTVQAFDVDAVLEHAARCARVTGTAVVVDGGQRLHALGNRDEVLTALGNLLTNVRRHAPGAGVVLHAKRHRSAIVLTVDDDGPGIPMAEQDRILQRGERGTTAAPGDGLGLYTAATALRRQGGELLISTRPEGGTRVTITLRAGAAAAVSRGGDRTAAACTALAS